MDERRRMRSTVHQSALNATTLQISTVSWALMTTSVQRHERPAKHGSGADYHQTLEGGA